MKNVLFVLSSYYPRPSANGVCAQMIAEEYLKRGYKVFCICHAQSSDMTKRTIKGVEIHFIKHLLKDLMFEKRMMAKSNLQRYIYYTLQRFCSYFNTIDTFFSFPVSKRMSKRFYSKIKEICIQNDIDIIISINQPIEAVYAAMLIKQKLPDIRFVAYLLDPICGVSNHLLISEKESLIKKQDIEKKVLNVADVVIAQITHKTKLNYLPNSIQNKIQYLGVPLLTNHIINKPKAIKYEDYTIIYAGTVDSNYRPATFIIKALALSKKIKLKMFLTAGFESAFRLTNELNASNITVSGPIDRDILLKEYEDADCLLNIGNTMKDQMPSKIFEYMSYGKPIISTYRIENDTSKEIVEKYPACLCIDERTENLENVAKQIEIFLSKELPSIDFNLLKEIYPEYLPETFVDIVN